MTAPRRTILVVDDDVVLRQVLELWLTDQGHRVIGAGSAETAYDLVAAERPDALLLDSQLPTMSGLALYLAIVHRWPDLEGRIAIEEVTRRYPRLEMAGTPVRRPLLVLRGFESAPVRARY